MKISRPLLSVLMALALLAAIVSLTAAGEIQRVTVDRQVPVPAPAEVSKLVAPYPEENGEFGRSVATNGRFVVIGAPGIVHDHSRMSDGSAHVYVRKGWGYIHRQKLVSNDQQDDESFGRSVGVFGNTIAVGAEHDNSSGNVYSGAVYIFERTRHGWMWRQKLAPDDLWDSDHFGNSLAIYEDTLVIGTWGADKVYVYERDGETWVQRQVIRMPPPNHRNFGHSVSLFKDTLVVGAEWNDHSDHDAAGAAYVFERFDQAFVNTHALIALDAEDEDHFGSSVSVSGDTIVVGAQGDDHGTDENSGSAYVFTRAGEHWIRAKKLTPPTVRGWQQFGRSVAVSRNRIAVGAPGDSPLGPWGTGCGFEFKCVAGDWCYRDPVVSNDAAAGDHLGEVALHGHISVFGAREANHSGLENAGAAYVVLLP